MSELELWKLAGYSDCHAAIICLIFSAVWAVVFALYKTDVKKQIENLKAKNDKLNYISKTQFDAEFKIYQELSEPIFDMFFDVMQLFPMGLYHVPEDETDRKNFYENRYKSAMEKLLIFQKKLYVYAPFIQKEIYEKFDKFRLEAQKQVNWYPDFIINPDKDSAFELRDEKRKCWERTNELYKQYGEIIVNLREYLQTLRVTEDK